MKYVNPVFKSMSTMGNKAITGCSAAETGNNNEFNGFVNAFSIWGEI